MTGPSRLRSRRAGRRRPNAVAPAPPRVELRGISKRFAATQALDDVSLDLLPGEVHALVGENGAGKSTLVKILAGVHQPDSGTIWLDGQETQIAGPAQSRALGIAVVHQEPRLFPDLTVAENVFIGHAPAGRFGSSTGARRAGRHRPCSTSSRCASTSEPPCAASPWRTSSSSRSRSRCRSKRGC